MKPISFTTIMAKARRDGRKKQTRRIMNPQPQFITGNGKRVYADKDFKKSWEDIRGTCEGSGWSDCPFGQVGDKLWAKEEHYLFGHWIKNGTTKLGRQKWKFVNFDGHKPDLVVLYAENSPREFRVSRDVENPEEKQWYKRLARFMPKKYARDFPTITGIRVERLLDISEEDAKLEGVERMYQFEDNQYYLPDPETEKEVGIYSDYRTGFMCTISQIHGPEIIENNPFVWVLELD